MNLELKEGLGCWGYIQRKLTYLGSRRARCCLLSTSCTPSTLHMKPLFVTFLQRKQHHRFMVEGKTGFGKVNDVPSSRSLLIKEAEWCSSLEALKGEPLDVDTLSMGFWDYHLRKLLSFCACSILFICKRSCICCLREHENQLCNTSPRAWHTEGIQWVQWLLPLLLSLLLLFSLQGKCRVSHTVHTHAPKPPSRVRSCQGVSWGLSSKQPGSRWARTWPFTRQDLRKWGGRRGERHSYWLRRWASPNHHPAVCSLPVCPRKQVRRKESWRDGLQILSCVISVSRFFWNTFLTTLWVTNCDQTWNSCSLSWSKLES